MEQNKNPPTTMSTMEEGTIIKTNNTKLNLLPQTTNRKNTRKFKLNPLAKVCNG